MIHVDKSQLRQVRYLLTQAAQGNHVLFDTETLRQALQDDVESFSEADLYGVEPFIERLILQPNLEAKRAYLDSLDREVYLKLVRAWINIIENNVYDDPEARH